MTTKTPLYWNLLNFIGIPIIIPVIAVIAGSLKPLFGIYAAVGIFFMLVLGDRLGRFMYSSARKSLRGVIYWFISGVILGGWSAIALSKPWGVLGGTLFGVTLGVLIVAIGYLEYKSSVE